MSGTALRQATTAESRVIAVNGRICEAPLVADAARTGGEAADDGADESDGGDAHDDDVAPDLFLVAVDVRDRNRRQYDDAVDVVQILTRLAALEDQQEAEDGLQHAAGGRRGEQEAKDGGERSRGALGGRAPSTCVEQRKPGDQRRGAERENDGRHGGMQVEQEL